MASTTVESFWTRYLIEVQGAGVPEKQQRWIVKRAEQYIAWLQPGRLKDQKPEDVTAYFEEIGRTGRLNSFQYEQVVLSVELLHCFLVPDCGWAKSFNWEEKKALGQKLEACHPTIARDADYDELEANGDWGGQGLYATVRDKHGDIVQGIIDVIRKKRYAYSTEKLYAQWICRFIDYFDMRNPRELREKEVAEFLEYLALKRRVAASTQNQALNALVFTYRWVLKAPLGEFPEVVRAKRPRRLPNVLPRRQVRALLEQMEADFKREIMHTMAYLCYGTGMRSCNADFA